MLGNTHRGGYVCASQHGGCGGTRVREEWADHPLISLVLERRRKKATKTQQTVDHTEAIAEVNAKIDRLRAMVTVGDLDPEDFTPLARAEREKRRALVREEAESKRQVSPAFEAYRSWDDMNLSQQRALVVRYVEQVVVVHPRESTGPGRYEPHRLEIFWTDGSVQRPTEDDTRYDPSLGTLYGQRHEDLATQGQGRQGAQGSSDQPGEGQPLPQASGQVPGDTAMDQLDVVVKALWKRGWDVEGYGKAPEEAVLRALKRVQVKNFGKGPQSDGLLGPMTAGLLGINSHWEPLPEWDDSCC